MQPGSVLIWPDRTGGIEVAPIDRLSWTARTLVILLKGGRRVVLRVEPATLATLAKHQDELRILRFVVPPPMVIG
jgi:hypothetical protein